MPGDHAPYRLAARWYRLDRPAIAVRVFEEDEGAPRKLLDLADLDTPLDKLRTRGMDVRHNHLHALDRAWRWRRSTSPVPIAMEQADPGGVSCTKRIVSLTVKSWSAWNPAFSV